MRTRAKYAIAGALAALISLPLAPAFASSHREAPGITEAPKVDGTDFYMFRSYQPGREGFVTFLANYLPLQAPYGGPNYFTMDPDAIYEIHIDNNGDAVEDITYQFKFDNNLANGGRGITRTVGGNTLSVALRADGPIDSATDPNLGETEQYTLTQIDGDRRTGMRRPVTNANGGSMTFGKPLDYVGQKTIPLPPAGPGYTAYADSFIFNVNLPGCTTPGRVFVGQRAEAFAVNLGEVFDLVNIVPVDGDAVRGSGQGGGFPMGIRQSRGNDDLVGEHNITTLALEVPTNCLLRTNGSPIIGAWTTASLPQATLADPTPTYEANNLRGGAYVQKSRLSAPLVNEFVIGIPDKNTFNASEPSGDGQFINYVRTPTLPALLNDLFRTAVNQLAGANFADLAPTNFPRNDLVAAFLTGFAIPGATPGSAPVFTNVNGSTAEMMRLNTSVNPTAAAMQNPLGILGGDLAGFPNGRRPGDDVVDIELRVAMGALCHVPALSSVCTPQQAAVGNQAFTDGAPISATDIMLRPNFTFPYLGTPIPGSPNDPPRAP